jgi:hypothetical protein
MMLLTLRSLCRQASRATHFVVRSLAYAPADASNPDRWTLFPHIEKRFDSIKSVAECWSVRIAPETVCAWPMPARPALSPARRTLGLTARRFVDLGRTESMMCHLHAA